MIVSTYWLRIFELMQPIFGTYLLLYFAYNKTVSLPNFTKYGDFSYGVYLYGWPIQQVVMLYLGNKLGVFGLFIISFLIVIPFAVVSWFLIEKPFVNLKGKQFQLGRVQVNI